MCTYTTINSTRVLLVLKAITSTRVDGNPQCAVGRRMNGVSKQENGNTYWYQPLESCHLF